MKHSQLAQMGFASKQALISHGANATTQQLWIPNALQKVSLTQWVSSFSLWAQIPHTRQKHPRGKEISSAYLLLKLFSCARLPGWPSPPWPNKVFPRSQKKRHIRGRSVKLHASPLPPEASFPFPKFWLGAQSLDLFSNQSHHLILLDSMIWNSYTISYSFIEAFLSCISAIRTGLKTGIARAFTECLKYVRHGSHHIYHFNRLAQSSFAIDFSFLF